jgi:hypothetical protein
MKSSVVKRSIAIDGHQTSITEYELRMLARDTYAQARASNNPLTKRRLVSLADNYLRQADELLCQRIIHYRQSERKIG